jgi:hypothetical protein
MVAYKLTPAVFTTVTLLPLALFPLSRYGGAMAWGHLSSMVICMLHRISLCPLLSFPLHHTLWFTSKFILSRLSYSQYWGEFALAAATAQN